MRRRQQLFLSIAPTAPAKSSREGVSEHVLREEPIGYRNNSPAFEAYESDLVCKKGRYVSSYSTRRIDQRWSAYEGAEGIALDKISKEFTYTEKETCVAHRGR